VETESPCIAKTGFKLTILLPQPPEYWNHSHVPWCWAMTADFLWDTMQVRCKWNN
jgi:hypothetical protein